MSLLARFSHKPVGSQPPAQLPCRHSELAPRWDSVEDMGRSDRVTHYVCTNCGERVSRDVAAARPATA